MRRMITEKDVEKLDSIKPSEIEKLGAMQDPKTATANYVLTADGKGKATYKPAGGQSYGSTSVDVNVRLTVYPSGEPTSIGAACTVLLPRETGKNILAVINPNLYNVIYKGQDLDLSRIQVNSSGGSGFTVRIPKTVSEEIGMTDGSNINVKCGPLYAYVAS